MWPCFFLQTLVHFFHILRKEAQQHLARDARSGSTAEDRQGRSLEDGAGKFPHIWDDIRTDPNMLVTPN